MSNGPHHRQRDSNTNLSSGVTTSIETVVISKRKTDWSEALGRTGGEVCRLDKEGPVYAANIGVKWERNTIEITFIEKKPGVLELRNLLNNTISCRW